MSDLILRVTKCLQSGVDSINGVLHKQQERMTPEKWNHYVNHTEKKFWITGKIKNFPEVQEILIDLQVSEEEDEIQEMGSP
ncbi:Protein of unknown function [Gryllus bimaculatus]|nr:Protein of unknown function [Gryllus bimaculatus]